MHLPPSAAQSEAVQQARLSLETLGTATLTLGEWEDEVEELVVVDVVDDGEGIISICEVVVMFVCNNSVNCRER